MSTLDDKDWQKRHASVQEVIDENAKLREQLATAEALLHTSLCSESVWMQRAEAAEAKLKALLAQAREEGRKEAVPDGWQVVPKEPTSDMQDVGGRLCLAVWYAMLAAAPKPEEKE